jgi:glycosyltransferase involved in cell wall biosynthesis
MSELDLDPTTLLAAESIAKDDRQLDFQYVLLAKPVADIQIAIESNSAFSNAVGVRIVCLLITDLSSALVELRLRLPLERWAMQNDGHVRFACIFNYTADDIEWGDVFVFHREAAGKYGLALIKFLKAHGKKVVFEIDDLLTDLPSFLLSHADSVVNKKYLIGSLQNADAITVTTNRLGKELSVYNKNIHCVPNCSENLYNHVAEHQQTPPQKVTLIIASSDNVLVHFIVDALKLAQEKFAVQILVIGPLGEYLENAGLTIKRAANMRYYDFKEFVASINNGIGLIPLDDSLFSSCKSAIKYFDYSLAGIPSVCSNVPPYSDHIINGKNGFLVENTVESWFVAIDLLVLNHTLRAEISESATHYVHHNYDWKTAANAWQTLIAPMSQDIFAERAINKPIKFPPLTRKRLFSKIVSVLKLPIVYKRAFQIVRTDGITGLIHKISDSLRT